VPGDSGPLNEAMIVESTLSTQTRRSGMTAFRLVSIPRRQGVLGLRFFEVSACYIVDSAWASLGPRTTHNNY